MKYLFIILFLSATFAQVEVPVNQDTFTANNSFADRALHRVTYMSVQDFGGWESTSYLHFELPEEREALADITLTVSANGNASNEAVIIFSHVGPFNESAVTHNSRPEVIDEIGIFSVTGLGNGDTLTFQVLLPETGDLYLALKPTEGLRRIDFITTEGGRPAVLNMIQAEDTPPELPDEDNRPTVRLSAENLIRQLAENNITLDLGSISFEFYTSDDQAMLEMKGDSYLFNAILVWIQSLQ